MRTAVADGGFYCVTCYIGFCTLRCTKMDSKKKKKVEGMHVSIRSIVDQFPQLYISSTVVTKHH